MLPLTAIVYRSRDWRGDESKRDYMAANCLELNIGDVSEHLEPEKYKGELIDKLVSSVEEHITFALRNYPDPNEIYLSGVNPDPNKVIRNRPLLFREPMEEYVALLDSALRGYMPLVVWEPKIIKPPEDTVWLPFPVILYFFEIGNFVWDHTKEHKE